MEAYAARRRSELQQQWLVIRHAQTSDEENPQSILPPLTTAAGQHDDGEGDEDRFDAVALVQQARQNEGK